MCIDIVLMSLIRVALRHEAWQSCLRCLCWLFPFVRRVAFRLVLLARMAAREAVMQLNLHVFLRQWQVSAAMSIPPRPTLEAEFDTVLDRKVAACA